MSKHRFISTILFCLFVLQSSVISASTVAIPAAAAAVEAIAAVAVSFFAGTGKLQRREHSLHHYVGDIHLFSPSYLEEVKKNRSSSGKVLPLLVLYSSSSPIQSLFNAKISLLEPLTRNSGVENIRNLALGGYFKEARNLASRYSHNSSTSEAVWILLHQLGHAKYNAFNILSFCDCDPMWKNLSQQTKENIAKDSSRFTALNLELLIRHQLVKELEERFEIKQPSGPLRQLLYELITKEPEQKVELLLSRANDTEVFAAFFTENGILKCFADHPFASEYKGAKLPSDKQAFLRSKLNKTLCLYGAVEKDPFVFQAYAYGITCALRGDTAYGCFEFKDPTLEELHSWADEALVFAVHNEMQQQPKNNQKKGAHQEKNDSGGGNKGDDNEECEGCPAFKKEVESTVAAAAAACAALKKHMKKICTKSTEWASKASKWAIDKMRINVRHTLHGDVRRGAPKGCHSWKGRCCNRINQTKNWGDKYPSVAKIVRNGKEKTSSLFPKSWSSKRIFKHIEKCAEHGKWSGLTESTNRPGIFSFDIERRCCGYKLEVVYNSKLNEIESIYPKTKDLVNLFKGGPVDCSKCC